MGTVRYMSPEQVAGRPGAVDQRTDVYSLGITLYELATLREAFAGTDRQALLRSVAEAEPRPPWQLNPAIPLDFETILLKAIAKSPQDRYATAKELADDLRHFLAGETVLARRAGLADQAAKWARRHRTLVAAAAAMLLLVLLGSVAGTLLIAREQARPPRRRPRPRPTIARPAASSIVSRSGTRKSWPACPGAERLRQASWPTPSPTTSSSSSKRAGTVIWAGRPGNDPLPDRPHYRATGRPRPGAAAYRRAERLFERLAGQPSAPADYRDERALCDNNIGLLLGQAGKTLQAEAAFRQAIALLEAAAGETAKNNGPGRRVKIESDRALCHGNLALLLAEAGRTSEAEASYRAAIEAPVAVGGRASEGGQVCRRLGPELQQPELPAEQDRRGEGPAVLPGGRRHPGKAGGRRPRQRGLASDLR